MCYIANYLDQETQKGNGFYLYDNRKRNHLTIMIMITNFLRPLWFLYIYIWRHDMAVSLHQEKQQQDVGAHEVLLLSLLTVANSFTRASHHAEVLYQYLKSSFFLWYWRFIKSVVCWYLASTVLRVVPREAGPAAAENIPSNKLWLYIVFSFYFILLPHPVPYKIPLKLLSWVWFQSEGNS